VTDWTVIASVDINCDMGESYGALRIGEDAEVFPWITSANVACGYHGGDPRTMASTVESAARFGVAVGAHPGFPDLAGFGRRYMHVSAEEARTDVLYQIGALHAFARAAGLQLQHVKPHGQLNNVAVRDVEIAEAIVDAVAAFDPALLLVSYGGELTRAAERRGLAVAHEGYADREYRADGTLVPRSQENAVIHDVGRIVARGIAMVREQRVTALTGEIVPLRVDTICVHGDTPGAGSIAKALHHGLRSTGIALRPMREVLVERA
jgi:UPF0271 protein